MLKIADKSPTWSCEDQDGVTRTSAEYSGKWLLLYFYPKDDTPGCTIEACGFRDHYKQFAGRIAIVGVSADAKESHQKFRKKFNLPFPLLADIERTMIETFGADGMTLPKRTTFLVDPQGTIRKIYAKIDCASHASDIENDLRALGL